MSFAFLCVSGLFHSIDPSFENRAESAATHQSKSPFGGEAVAVCEICHEITITDEKRIRVFMGALLANRPVFPETPRTVLNTDLKKGVVPCRKYDSCDGLHVPIGSHSDRHPAPHRSDPLAAKTMAMAWPADEDGQGDVFVQIPKIFPSR